MKASAKSFYDKMKPSPPQTKSNFTQKKIYFFDFFSVFDNTSEVFQPILLV